MICLELKKEESKKAEYRLLGIKDGYCLRDTEILFGVLGKL